MSHLGGSLWIITDYTVEPSHVSFGRQSLDYN